MIALYNGKVYSQNKFYEGILLDGKRIKYIGSSKDIKAMADGNTGEIDLKGRLVLPGFIDSHAHGGWSVSLTLNKIDLSEAETVQECLDIVKRYIKENPDMDIYQGIGWTSPIFGEKGPDKKILDEICADKPIVLKAIEGHAVWVNSQAIKAAGITLEMPVPTGGVAVKDDEGSFTGLFKDEAQAMIEDNIPETSVEVFKAAILEYQREMVKLGITGASEMHMFRYKNLHRAYQELADEGRLLIKAIMHYEVSPNEDMEAVRARMKNPQPEFKNKLSQGNYAKIFIDGVVENGTAWLKNPYSNDKNHYGIKLWNDQQLFDVCSELDKMGYDIHFHVIGDAAVSQMVRAVEYVVKSNGKRNRRYVAAHVQLADKGDIAKMAELGICVSANSYWFGEEKNYHEIEKASLGSRADRQYPMKSLMDSGITVSVGSDYSVTIDPNPIVAIKMGIERSFRDIFPDSSEVLWEEECVDFKRMLDAVTINSAYTCRIDNETGSLEAGKLADLIVTDKNIFDLSSSELQKVKIDMTISEGEIVYQK